MLGAEGRCCNVGRAAAVCMLASGTGPYLQQGLGGFMDGNNVGNLVPAELLQVFGIYRIKVDIGT